MNREWPEDGGLQPETLEPFGRDLHRPECVLATRSGGVYVSDWRGGVTAIRENGRQQEWLATASGCDLRPNGIALTASSAFLLADLGETGGVWRLDTDGSLTALVTDVDGVSIPPTNFVTTDRLNRTWISVSTREQPRQRAWRPGHADGFVVLLDDRGPRIVADRLAYTNEVRVDPSGKWLYVVETYGRRLIRFPILQDGVLGASETVVTFGHASFPDGFAFDEDGGIWITTLVSNRVLRFCDDALEVMIEDLNPAFANAADEAFAAGTMSAEHLGPIPETRLQQVTSIAFGCPDRRTAYLGSLHSTCLYRFRSPVAGSAPEHWDFPVP